MKKEIKVQGLCFRCEHRAKHLDSKKQYQPRCECGMIETSVCGCYMYQPVKPVVTGIMDGYDGRPRFGPSMICARECGVGVAENIELHVHEIDKKKAYLYWKPK